MENLKVLVVDDAAIYRKIVSQVLESLDGVEIVGSVSNGSLALDRLERQNIDIMTLDVEMPVMDGIETLREMKSRGLKCSVVMVSALTRKGAETTLKALELGAADFVEKPAVGSKESPKEILRKRLSSIIRNLQTKHILKGTKEHKSIAHLLKQDIPEFVNPIESPTQNFDILGIGISTGGPSALTELIPAIKIKSIPIVIVQHMPAGFIASLAMSLDQKSELNVCEAKHNQELKPGHVYIAPGEKQMALYRKGSGVFCNINDDPPENNCKPAADYLFREISKIYKERALGLIMTGMGSDGTAGLKVLKEKNGYVLSQDAESCTIFGMPKEAQKAGVVDEVWPLNKLAERIALLVEKKNA